MYDKCVTWATRSKLVHFQKNVGWYVSLPVNTRGLILLWTLQICVTFGISTDDLNLNEGDPCSVYQENGVCKYIYDCEKPCTGKRKRNVYCQKSNGIVCCPLPRHGLRISASKCAEYKESACLAINVANVRTEKIPNCPFAIVGGEHAVRRALPHVGGKDAGRREFPHMALIGYVDVLGTTEWDCGGTLISDQFVLTAAHCIERTKGRPKLVRLGEHDIDRIDEADSIDLSVIDWIMHPGYNSKNRYYDIGLLKLNGTVEFTKAIRAACLPEESITNDKAIATGWGEYAPQKRSNVLKKVMLDMISQNECKDIYQPFDAILSSGIDETQVCAGSEHFMNHTCRGDSGGPLQIYHKIHYCSYTVIGITSFGTPCNDVGSSTVFTRVFRFLDWIEDIVWPKQNI